MIRRPIDNLIIICNVKINELSGDSREAFLSKIRGVKAIRCWWTRYTSFYLASSREFINLKHIYDVVNYGVFDMSDSYKYRFAVGLPFKLYNWLLSTDFDVIQRQIINWMSFQYFYQADKREIYNDQFYPPALEEIKKNIRSIYFPLVQLPKTASVKNVDGESLFERWKHQEIIDFYHATCMDVYSSLPPEFLADPFDWYTNADEWGIEGFDFGFLDAYFKESDWENVIINEGIDNLERVESRADIWNKWRHTFTTYEKSGKQVYSFYLADTLVATTNKDKKNRIRKENSVNLEKIIEYISKYNFIRAFEEFEEIKQGMSEDQLEVLTMLRMKHKRVSSQRLLGILDNPNKEENKLAYDIISFVNILKN